MTEPKYLPFESLPLFPTEEELAIAIRGRKYAKDWKQFSLYYERKGMPKMDFVIGRRYKYAVKKFFDKHWNLDGPRPMQDGPERPELWNVRRKPGRPRKLPE